MKFLKTIFYTCLTLLPMQQAWSISGDYCWGFGVKARGMGGVGIALPQDSVVGVMNPAGMAWVGDRWDIGIIDFAPFKATAKVNGNALPSNNGHWVTRPTVIIGEGGFNKMLTCDLSVGVSFYPRGAGQFYGKHIGLLGTKRAGAELNVLTIVPSIAYKLDCVNTIGIGIDIVASRFKAKGLQNFKQASIHPHHVTNRSWDYRPGIGLQLGWLGRITDCLTLGASYQTTSWTKRYKKYKGLLPDHGALCEPQNFGFGVAYQYNPCLVLSFDIQRFLWKNEKFWGNKLTLTKPFGSKKGTGAGWRNQTVFKFGAAYEYSEQLTLRAGYDHCTQVQPKSQNLNNLLLMLFFRNALTCGATWAWNCNEVDFFYNYGFKQKLRDGVPAAFGGGDIKVTTYYHMIGLSFGHKF